LPYALWLAREVRRVLPECYIVCGGTEISDIWKYTLQRDRLGELFDGVNACIVGEGESAFVELLEALRDGRRPTSLANTVVFSEDRVMTPPPKITYENLDALPTPEYELLEDRGYFSPTRFVYYSPTRGCYWNRCTFCDYGLNFGTPTSPWRQRKLETVLDDLRKISAQSRFVYLSVDVLAPATIVKLARAVADEGIDVRWGAEVRLEKHFNDEACHALRRSGCVGISVGFESGCQRVLDAIDKGTKIDAIAATLGHFHDHDIAVQMMGFTGFPSETAAEALESVAFLEAHRDKWVVAGLGEFVLTPGAIVAMRPADFGIVECGAHTDDDIARVLRFREASPVSAEEREVIAASKRTLTRQNFDRPFAGGIDTPHSMFYYDRYATAFPGGVVKSFERKRSEVGDVALSLNGRIIDDVCFDPWQCPGADVIPEMRTRIGREEGRMLRAAEFAARIDAETPRLARFERPMTYFLRNDGASFPLSRDLHDVLVAIERGDRLEEAVARVSSRAGADQVFLSLAALLIPAGGLAVPAKRTAALTGA
jgi:anaerobic magnesium-protoporphyrin IX monomethyl ester cyclase